MNGWEISGQGGSWDTYEGRVSYGHRFTQAETLLSGTFYKSDGQKRLFFSEFDSPTTNHGIAVDADGDESYSVFADVIRGDFDIHAVLNSRTKHIPTASFGTVFNDPRTQTTDARRYVDLQYRIRWGVNGTFWAAPRSIGMGITDYTFTIMQIWAFRHLRRISIWRPGHGRISSLMPLDVLRNRQPSVARGRISRRFRTEPVELRF